MSHIVTITTQIRDPVAIELACDRLQLAKPQAGEHQLFSKVAEGLAVRLRDWRYPIVCQPATGELLYDNYGGRWGNQQRLDEFVQAYAVEQAKRQARLRGYGVTERLLADGSVRLTLSVGGA